MKPRKVIIYNDSQLVMGQVCSQFEAKEEKMATYQKKDTGIARVDKRGRH